MRGERGALSAKMGEERGAAAGMRGERGATSVMVVLFLPVLLLCLYATCGVGATLLGRARAQAAADLAALAAAQNVDLERLAQGERRLDPESAMRDAAAWARANLDAARRLFAAGVAPVITVDVYNPLPGEPMRHRRSGRELTDPTVAVTVRLRAAPAAGPLTAHDIEATADASVLERLEDEEEED
jgi:uncharacterized membrane protein